MTPDAVATLLAADRAHVWHPYASGVDPLPVVPVVGASGTRLQLADGRELVDGMSNWWAAIHGHGHPVLRDALVAQADRLPHIMFGGLTHEPAVALAQRLVEVTPEPLTKVFFSDSGSVAVEVALKMALQFHAGRGSPRSQVLTVRGGYHGDTLGAMSVCDPVTGMHTLFADYVPQQLFVQRPRPRYDEQVRDDDLAGIEAALQAGAGHIAAVVVEPIVQGAGGMWFYAPEYLRRLKSLCLEYDVLLVLDEIATGFGRSGRLFGLEHAGVVPDIMCVGKALTGGMMSLAATLCTDEVAAGVSAAEGGALMHGPTFMGNPLACAVALASVDLLLSGPWQQRVQHLQSEFERRLAPARELPAVADVRVLGAIGVIELHEPVDMAVVQPALVQRGVWVRPFGRLVYLMPPYITDDADLATLTGAVLEVVDRYGALPAGPR